MRSVVIVVHGLRGGIDVTGWKWQARLGWLLGSLRRLGER